MPDTINMREGQGYTRIDDDRYEEAPRLVNDPARERGESIQTTGSELTRLSGPLAKLDPTKLNSTSELLAQLSRQLPLNEYDLPIFIYRPDMLDCAQFANTLKAQEAARQDPGDTTTTVSFPPARGGSSGTQALEESLDAATVYLTYDEGFPVMPSGIPFWQQLEFETRREYEAFTSYLELGGARQLNNMTGWSPLELREMYYRNFWMFRVKAFDLYRTVHHQQLKLQRMLAAEDNHYAVANRAMEKVVEFFEKMELDPEEIPADKVVAMFEKLVKIQRISIGLPASGESKENTGVREAPSMQVVMQQIAQSNQSQKADGANDLDWIDDDPESIEAAQRLILKTQQHGSR